MTDQVDEIAANVLLLNGIPPLTALAASTIDAKSQRHNGRWLLNVAMLIGLAAGIFIILLIL